MGFYIVPHAKNDRTRRAFVIERSHVLDMCRFKTKRKFLYTATLGRVHILANFLQQTVCYTKKNMMVVITQFVKKKVDM